MPSEVQGEYADCCSQSETALRPWQPLPLVHTAEVLCVELAQVAIDVAVLVAVLMAVAEAVAAEAAAAAAAEAAEEAAEEEAEEEAPVEVAASEGDRWPWWWWKPRARSPHLHSRPSPRSH